MTASRAFARPELVAEETRLKVLKAAEQIGYQRNSLARALRPGGRSGLIGVVVANIANPFYSSLAQGIDEELQRRGYRMMLAHSADDAEREQAVLNDLRTWRVDGIVIVPAAGASALESLRPGSGSAPVVIVGRGSGGGDFDEVLVDDLDGARVAVADLLAQGHRRIAYVGNEAILPTSVDRLRGYRCALAEAGLQADESLVKQGCETVEQARMAMAGLLASATPPTAVFAGNNRAMVGALKAMREADRMLVVNGFDELELAELLKVRCGMMSFDAVAMGRTSAELIVSRLAGESVGASRRVIVPSVLVHAGGTLGE